MVAADAAAARHLSAARDRDLADLGVKVDANRRTINALGIQTAARFDRVDQRLEQMGGRLDQVDGRLDSLENRVDTGFAQMRAKFDQTAAGFERIGDLLTILIERDEDPQE